MIYTLTGLISSLAITLLTTTTTITASPILKRSQFTGIGTWYGAGVSIGNCGGQSSGYESVVALNTAQYGSTDQVSQYCGQTVTISYNGIIKQAIVVDSCPTCSYGDLDMSKSLFSSFTNNDLGLGVIPISWSFGASNDVASVSNSNPNPNPVPVSVGQVSPTTDATAAPTVTEIVATATVTLPAPTLAVAAAAASTSTSSSSPPMPTQTITSTPQWWAVLGSSNCPNVILPAGLDPVAISPSKLAQDQDALSAACGKTVQITNPALNRTTVAMLTNYYLSGQEPNNTIFMDQAYLKIANTASTLQGIFPYKIDNVTWGFLD